MNLSFVLLDAEQGIAMAIMPDASLLKLQALLDTDTIKIVNVNIEGADYYLLVDENAKARRKQFNNLASLAAGQAIVGDAAAVLPQDFKALPFNQEKENDTMQ